MAPNGTPGSVLTARQQRAVAVLLVSRDALSAAETVGISERTMRRWMQDPSFRAALAAAEGELIGDAVRSLVGDLKRNHSVMRSVRDNPEQPGAGVRLRAAQALDGTLMKWRELADFELRLSELEEAVYGENSRKKN